MKKLLLALVFFLMPACAMADEPALWQGNALSVKERSTAIATDEAGWQGIWSRVGQPAPQTLPADTVAVAVFIGERRTGGYSIEFLNVREETAQRVVTYRIKRPRFDEPSIQVLTSPYAVRLLPHSDKPTILEQTY